MLPYSSLLSYRSIAGLNVSMIHDAASESPDAVVNLLESHWQVGTVKQAFHKIIKFSGISFGVFPIIRPWNLCQHLINNYVPLVAMPNTMSAVEINFAEFLEAYLCIIRPKFLKIVSTNWAGRCFAILVLINYVPIGTGNLVCYYAVRNTIEQVLHYVVR